MKDAWTVAKKEIKELVAIHLDRGGLVQLVSFIAVFGVFFPLSQKAVWMTTPVPAFYCLLIPALAINGIVADSFAGERERDTLETLLATRLPDAAILLGKVAAAVAYGWAFGAFTLLVSLAVLNLSAGGPFLYELPVLLVGLLGSMLTALLASGIGVFVSLRAKTVRAATQSLRLPLMLMVLGLPVLLTALPETSRRALLAWASGLDPLEAVAVLLAFLAAASFLVLKLALRRFRRTRLIL